jgi:NNP family nitrate/nitrite transporter-like MFS transporter
MSAGATYSVVPFINRRALGAVAGIVGAGGNAGAVLGGLLFRSSIATSTAFMWLGVAVVFSSSCALLLRFNAAEESAALPSVPSDAAADLAVALSPAE